MTAPYRTRPGYPLQTCAAAWEKHRKNQRILIALYAGLFPSFLLAGCLIAGYPRIFHDFPYIMVLYVACIWIASFRFSRFRCPRCGNRFDAFGPLGMGHNSFARKCRNCGLRKWECPGDTSPIEPR
jgi:hypothetical protein